MCRNFDLLFHVPFGVGTTKYGEEIYEAFPPTLNFTEAQTHKDTKSPELYFGYFKIRRSR